MDISETTQPAEPGRGPSRRLVLAGAAGLSLSGLVAPTRALAGETAAATAPAAVFPQRPKHFVRVRQGQFFLEGMPWRFGGTNCYYLHEKSHYMIDNMLDDAAQMGDRVVRAWAFIDGDPHNGKALQPEPFVYDSDAFDSLDYAIYKAGQLGIRLVLPLTNNWPDYGGMRQYVTWFLGLPDDTYGDAVNHDKFYTTEAIKKCYKAYARFVIRRRNPYTGLRYNEDPTIMTFELANEPRNRSDKTGRPLLAWADEMTRFFKGLAPNQLVAVGDEGFYGYTNNFDYPYSTFEGNKWKKLTALPAVDYGTYHLYPQGWGEVPANGKDPVVWGTKWISDHISDGRTLGKPVVLEEYGLHLEAATGVPDDATRDAGYTKWTDTVESKGGAGDQFWILTSRQDDGTLYPDYDGYRVVFGTSTSSLLAAHAARMAGA